jgi:hypothetical protein
MGVAKDLPTKKWVKNNGIVPQYYVENSHEAIIPKKAQIDNVERD